IARQDAPGHYNNGLVLLRTGRAVAAAAEFRAALEDRPTFTEAHYNLALARLQSRDWPGAAAEFGVALAQNPDHTGALNNLGWLLATCPVDSLRDGRRAVQLAESAVRRDSGRDADLLDTLAAAYAEAGRFADASATVQRAVSAATAAGHTDAAARMTARAALYENHQAYRMP